MAALNSNDLTEKTLAAGLNAAVDQHDAEAVKEESSTVGRGNHSRQVIYIYIYINMSRYIYKLRYF